MVENVGCNQVLAYGAYGKGGPISRTITVRRTIARCRPDRLSLGLLTPLHYQMAVRCGALRIVSDYWIAQRALPYSVVSAASRCLRVALHRAPRVPNRRVLQAKDFKHPTRPVDWWFSHMPNGELPSHQALSVDGRNQPVVVQNHHPRSECAALT